MGRTHLRGNFHAGFDAFHLLKLSTNRFFRVNSEQTWFHSLNLKYLPDQSSRNRTKISQPSEQWLILTERDARLIPSSRSFSQRRSDISYSSLCNKCSNNFQPIVWSIPYNMNSLKDGFSVKWKLRQWNTFQIYMNISMSVASDSWQTWFQV